MEQRVQVEFLEELDYGSWYYPKGVMVWLTKEEAEDCVKLGAVRVVTK